MEKRNLGKQSQGCRTNTATRVGSAVVVVVMLVLVIALAGGFGNGGNNQNFPNPDAVTLPPNDQETRDGNAYIGLFFLNSMPAPVEQAFDDAARKWSSILADSALSGAAINGGETICAGSIITNERLIFDHLIIAARTRQIDGRNGILGQAGPCLVASGFPVFGIMDFDSDDLDGLVNAGTIEAVITHEMGHVLGIGTLWPQFRLLQNPILGQNNQGQPFVLQTAVQPTFSGSDAIDEYQTLTGQSESGVPVEDGTSAGVELFTPRSTGAGSIDSHWDLDFLPGELMVFRIDPNQLSFPLSRVTIASLADLGYTVDFGEADSYNIGDFQQSSNLRGKNGPKAATMINDVLPYKPVDLAEFSP